MTSVAIFAILSVLLVAGKVLRIRIPIFQRLYLPSSVVGGLLGLLIISCFRTSIPVEWTDTMRAMPGFLINIIFATLFLGADIPKVRNMASTMFPQLTLAQVVVWGQFVIGIGLAGFVLMPTFHVAPAFGNLLELGFEGGHGTVGGIANTFRTYGWEDGIALGYTVATIGMISGIVVGMALVNWAYKRGYVKTLRPFSARSQNERRGIHPPDARPSAGHQTVLADSVDSLAWHIAIVGIAVLIGYGILQGLQYFEVVCFPHAKVRLFNGFPLFPLCMIAGAILQKGTSILKIDLLVDRDQMQRISGAALDVLSVSAVATIQISVVAANWLPLTIMCTAGLVWTIFAILFFAPRLFKEAWFERGIAEFGQATGVTATGLLLLRTVDPENKTIAASSFASKQLFNEPMMGMWVAFAFALVFTIGWLSVFWISAALFVAWLIVAFILMKKK